MVFIGFSVSVLIKKLMLGSEPNLSAALKGEKRSDTPLKTPS